MKKQKPFILVFDVRRIFSGKVNTIFFLLLRGLPMLDFNIERKEIDHLC